MPRREPPRTAEGLYALHDFRSVDWDAWRSATADDRHIAIEEGTDFFEAQASHDDGDFAVYSVLGHKADLFILTLRSTLAKLDTAARSFEQTRLATFTDRTSSYVSVTEASGYTDAASAYFDDEAEVDAGLARYMDARLHPTIQPVEFVCFYPMDKRRDPEYNWYDLPFAERAKLVSSHGEIGREYAGKVTQIITGSIGFDDWEWGVTLFTEDMTEIKHLLTTMRFDPSTSKYATFGPFYVGRRFPSTDLAAFFAGEAVPVDANTDPVDDSSTVRIEFDRLGVDIDAPPGAHGLVFFSTAAPEELETPLDGLRSNFEHYDSHVHTDVYADDDGAAIASVWTTEQAAATAAGFLSDLPGVTDSIDGPIGTDDADTSADELTADEIRTELDELDVYGGKPHGEDVYARVLYSEAERETLSPAVETLVNEFDQVTDHLRTTIYEGTETDRLAVVSIWKTRSAANTASSDLSELPGVVARAEEESGFGTMGMFYTVKPEHRGDFIETFTTVGELLADMDGHLETDLMVNVDDENDLFISSQWRAKEDAMVFFRSEAFRDTVRWGRDVLADRPRHVFLA